MVYSNWTRLLLASVLAEVDDELRQTMDPLLRQIVKTVITFLHNEVSSTSSLRFEEGLDQVLRDLGRIVTEWTYNHVEPEDPQSLPHDVHFESGGYRRLNHKTPNRNVATLFGKITLWRFGYRDWQREGGEPMLFPLERLLGLVGGASAALASVAGRYLAEAGATQGVVLDRLRREHGVEWGTKKLREVSARLADAMQPFCRTVSGGQGAGVAEASLRCQGKPAAGAVRRPRRDHVGDAAGQCFRGGHLRDDDRLRPPRETPGNDLLGSAAGTGATDNERRTDGIDRGGPLAVGRTDAAVVLRDRRGRQRNRLLSKGAPSDARIRSRANGWIGNGWSITIMPASGLRFWPKPCLARPGPRKAGPGGCGSCC